MSSLTNELAHEFNCGCVEVSPYPTLAALRIEQLIGMGYAAQASNPPPGMASVCDFYLRQAQAFLSLRYKEMPRTRFFCWTMVPGLRYYGIEEGDSGCNGVTLDRLKVQWVGFEDLNKTWVPMIEGIPPEFYTRAQTTDGWPSHYEIRSCLEIFPAPQAAYTLWVKGEAALAPFTADNDHPTLDDRAVLWWALAMQKQAYGKPDWETFQKMAIQRIKDITAGQHGTARFVPTPGGIMPPMTPPRFLPLGNAPA